MNQAMRTALGGVPEGRIRGAALREFLIWYADRHAADELDAAVDALTEAGQLAFQSGLPAYGVLSGRWYAATDIHALLEALAVHRLSPEEAKEGGRVVMKQTLAGVFRTVLRFLVTPERYAKHAQRIWSHYYDTGDFQVRPEGPGRSYSSVHHWTAHHPLLCEMNVSAAEVIYETMGCKNARARRLSCVDHGGSACEYEVAWDAA